MRKLEVSSFGAIGADIPGFDFDARFKIKSFTVLSAKGDVFTEYKCDFKGLTPDAKAAVNKVRAGGRIFIEDIIAVGPDNMERKLGNVTIRVKG